MCLRDLTPPHRAAVLFKLGCRARGAPVHYENTGCSFLSILRSAVRYGFLIQNPMVGLKLPRGKGARRQSRVISPEQFSNPWWSRCQSLTLRWLFVERVDSPPDLGTDRPEVALHPRQQQSNG